MSNTKETVVYNINEAAYESHLEYWKNQPTDNPNTINGFEGPFKLTDITKLPFDLMPFLVERFKLWSVDRKSVQRALESAVDSNDIMPSDRVTDILNIENVNAALNEVWGGPGSMVNVIEATQLMYKERKLAEQIAAESD